MKYKDYNLARNSLAYLLYQEMQKTGSSKKLDEHLKEVEKKYQDLFTKK